MIAGDETKLTGSWVRKGDLIVEDENCIRIRFLITDYLRRVTSDWSGWEVLFQDPLDNRYWELTYPHSDWHGGGPPALFCLNESEARKKYAF